MALRWAGKATGERLDDIIRRKQEKIATYGTPKQEAAKFVGSSAASLGRYAKKNTIPAIQGLNTKWGYMNSIGAGIALAPIAFARGEAKAEYDHKVKQITSNHESSADAGGTFLRQSFAPKVDDHAATGDLVFALRSLRYGG